MTGLLRRPPWERLLEMEMHYQRLKPGRSWEKLFQAALGATLLVGCAGAPGTAPVNLGGFSPAFKQGYTDGCESAGARSQRRDEARYTTESEYMQGWNDGFSACRRR
jgi:hypothetical protein